MSTQTTPTTTPANGRARREAKQAKRAQAPAAAPKPVPGALKATARAATAAPATKPSSQHDSPAPVVKAPAGPVLTPEEREEALALAHAELDRLVPALRPCGCGCGATTKGRFVPGHDAKLLSRLLAEAKAKVLARRTA